MFYFEQPECQPEDLTDRRRLDDMAASLKKHARLDYRAHIDLIKIIGGLLDRFDAIEETIKKVNEDMDLIRGYQSEKKAAKSGKYIKINVSRKKTAGGKQ